MPKHNSKSGGARTLTPAGYELHSVEITLNNGNITDVSNILIDLEIIENILGSSIRVIMRLADSINYLERSHLLGGEKVNIKLRRTANKDESFAESKEKFDIEGYIIIINNHNKMKQGLQLYDIECLSKHAMISNTKKLNRSFSGIIGQLVTNIFKNDLGLEDGVDFKSEDISDSAHNLKGIYPSLSPLGALSWLTRNSSNDGTPYFLYETLQDGLKFKSYNDIIENEEIYRIYNDRAFFDEVPNSKESYEELQKKILNMESDFNRSLYQSIRNGSYTSKLHTIDIASKNYKQTEYVYDNKYKINENNPFSLNIEFDNKKVNEYTTNKQYYVSLNSKAYDKDINYHHPASTSLLPKQSYLYNLSFMGLNMTIYGDFNLQVGKKVQIDMPKPFSFINDGLFDKYIGGNYITTSISHIFRNNEYRCSVALQKDSSVFDIDSDIEMGKNRKKDN